VADAPEVLASDAEREGALARLRDAVGEGRLTLEELAVRVEAALGARTRSDVEAVVADLPVASPAAAERRPGARWVVGIMGGDDRAGRWRIAERCTVVNVMGGSDLDLRQAIVEGDHTDILVVSLMGGSTITVPEGVVVEMGGFAFMGGNDLEAHGPAPARGAPTVRVRAFSIMGGTDVVVSSEGGPARRRLGPPPPPPAP
jgi:DUF1707 SHOCT-like domain/Cell wall-active antibiotics response LiaF, C-terminal